MEELVKLMNEPAFLQVILAVLGIVTIASNMRAYRSNKRADVSLKEAETRYNDTQQKNQDRQTANELRIEQLRAENAANQGIQRILEGLLKANIESNDNSAKERKANNDTIHALTDAITKLADSNRGVVDTIAEFRSYSIQQHAETRNVSQQAKASVDNAMSGVTENLIEMHKELERMRIMLNDGSPYLKEGMTRMEHQLNRLIKSVSATEPVSEGKKES